MKAKRLMKKKSSHHQNKKNKEKGLLLGNHLSFECTTSIQIETGSIYFFQQTFNIFDARLDYRSF